MSGVRILLRTHIKPRDFQLAKIQEEYNIKIVEKGKEINHFKEEYGIQVKDDTLRVERPLGKPSNESVLVEGK